MDFVKKNIALVIVLTITALLSMFLIYLDLQSHSKVTTILGSIGEYSKKLDTLFNGQQKPVAMNLKMINDDHADLIRKTRDFQRYFGKPYRASLQDFAMKISTPEDKLIEKFAEFYQGGGLQEDTQIKGMDPINLVKEFIKTFENPEQVEDAYKDFKISVQSQTIEDVNDEVAAQLFLCALGLPRTALPHRARHYIVTMNSLFAQKEMIPGANNVDAVKALTYDVTIVPSEDTIEPYFRQFQFFEDFFCSRIKKSGVARVVKLEKITGLYGVKEKDKYLRFSYNVNVQGDLPSIRNMVNLMQNAYKDNRVYVINSIVPARVANTEVENAIKKIADESKKFNVPDSGSKGDGDGGPSDYAKTLIGANKNIDVTIEFDYIIFTGDELKLKR